MASRQQNKFTLCEYEEIGRGVGAASGLSLAIYILGLDLCGFMSLLRALSGARWMLESTSLCPAAVRDASDGQHPAMFDVVSQRSMCIVAGTGTLELDLSDDNINGLDKINRGCQGLIVVARPPVIDIAGERGSVSSDW